MFTEALFIINKIWKQPVFIDGLMDKNIVVSVFVMKYLLFSQENEILLFVTTWMKLEGIFLSEISQTEKDKYHMFFLMCRILKNNKIIDTENRKVVIRRDWG